MGKDNLDGLLDSFNTSTGSLDDDLQGITNNKSKQTRNKSSIDNDKVAEMLRILNSGGPRQTILKDREINVAKDVNSVNLKSEEEDSIPEIDFDEMTRKEKKQYFRIMEAHEFDIEDVLGYPGDFRKEKLDKKFRKKFKIYKCASPRRVFRNPEEFADFFLEYHNQEKLAEKLLSDKKFYAFLRAHSSGDVEYRLQYKRFIQLVSTIFKEVDFSGEL